MSPWMFLVFNSHSSSSATFKITGYSMSPWTFLVFFNSHYSSSAVSNDIKIQDPGVQSTWTRFCCVLPDWRVYFPSFFTYLYLYIYKSHVQSLRSMHLGNYFIIDSYFLVIYVIYVIVIIKIVTQTGKKEYNTYSIISIQNSKLPAMCMSLSPPKQNKTHP